MVLEQLDIHVGKKTSEKISETLGQAKLSRTQSIKVKMDELGLSNIKRLFFKRLP